MSVGDGVVVGLVDCSREGKRGDAKTCFSAARAVYVHYFNDIRQGTLQSKCVMLWGVRDDISGSGVRGRALLI